MKNLKAGEQVIVLTVDDITSEKTFIETLLDEHPQINDAEVATFNGFGQFVFEDSHAS